MFALGVAAFLTLVQGSYAQSPYAQEDPSRQIQWWLENYRVASDEDPRIRRAYQIFESVLDVADKPAAVRPSLHIFADLKGLCALSLPNGPIVLSTDVLDFCYRDEQYAEGRLAFVLAHEIAHQVGGDWWHYNFFMATKTLEETGNSAMRDALWARAQRTDERKEKEQKADDYGILYAALAGFPVVPMIAEDDNFIGEWIVEAKPTEELKAHYPSAEERIAALRARLQHVVDRLALFEVGNRCYQTGYYQEAIEAFKTFATDFPSREVFNNLGLSYYQEALLTSPSPRRFKKSIQADPLSRASEVALALAQRGGPQEILERAIECFEEAVRRDPHYKIAHNNLGCALDLKDPYAAIGHFNTALGMDSTYKEAYNNRGISLLKIGQREKAAEDLIRASRLGSTYGDPLYNLGLIYWEAGDTVRARETWEKYVRCHPKGFWADRVRGYLGITSQKAQSILPSERRERVGGIAVDELDDVDVRLGSEAYELNTFTTERRRIVVRDVLYQGFKIITWEPIQGLRGGSPGGLIVAEESYEGTSALGIGIGTSVQELRERYGPPDRIERTTVGHTYIYLAQGILFDLVEDAVRSWCIF